MQDKIKQYLTRKGVDQWRVELRNFAEWLPEDRHASINFMTQMAGGFNKKLFVVFSVEDAWLEWSDYNRKTGRIWNSRVLSREQYPVLYKLIPQFLDIFCKKIS